jgi:Carboxypeptidase regulatory-like domain
MTTVILVGLIVVLLAAAAYVGVLLLRRTRSEPPVAPEVDEERPRTVADLVKRRSEPDDLSGPDLFAPAVPRQDGVAVPPAPVPAAAAVAQTAQPATPAGGLEVGDAPWRRAARMSGAEPGGAWETAPFPVTEDAATGGGTPDASANGSTRKGGRSTGVAASPSVVIVSRASAPVAPVPAPAPAPVSPWTEPEPAPAAPAPVVQASPWTAPSVPAGVEVEPAPETESVPDAQADAAPDDDDATVQAPADAEVADDSPAPAEPAPVSRPLSDPDLTPLMGIPVIRPVAAEVPGVVAALRDVPEPAAVAVVDVPHDDPEADPVPGPSPRIADTFLQDDDEVVVMEPTPTRSFPVVAAPVASGSPQPVWFRVVRRDGEPVAKAVVALLDDRGREVDTTKTAPDGGGELHTPHGGRFLMIVSADGYQPRAATLTVDEQPVELALLLPRSAAVAGSVHAGGVAVRAALVVVRQDHDVVDEALTAGDGRYRFDDLAEGFYTVAATGGPGSAVARINIGEGVDAEVDLDLAPPLFVR